MLFCFYVVCKTLAIGSSDSSITKTVCVLCWERTHTQWCSWCCCLNAGRNKQWLRWNSRTPLQFHKDFLSRSGYMRKCTIIRKCPAAVSCRCFSHFYLNSLLTSMTLLLSQTLSRLMGSLTACRTIHAYTLGVRLPKTTWCPGPDLWPSSKWEAQ